MGSKVGCRRRVDSTQKWGILRSCPENLLDKVAKR
jgi:hypothetical protein